MEKVRSKSTFMRLPLIVAAPLLLISCNNSTTTASVESANNDTVKIYLSYDEPINGFTVSATCFVDAISNYDSPASQGNQNAIVGKAYLHFKNGTIQFSVENPLFSDSTLMANETPLINGVKIKATYNSFKPDANSDNMIFNSGLSQSPFFFYDIDFDGQKELIVTLWEGMEYHGHNAYRAYKVKNSPDAVLEPMGKPFNQLDDYSQIDTIAKTISICKGIDAAKIQGYDTYKF